MGIIEAVNYYYESKMGIEMCQKFTGFDITNLIE